MIPTSIRTTRAMNPKVSKTLPRVASGTRNNLIMMVNRLLGAGQMFAVYRICMHQLSGEPNFQFRVRSGYPEVGGIFLLRSGSFNNPYSHGGTKSAAIRVASLKCKRVSLLEVALICH